MKSRSLSMLLLMLTVSCGSPIGTAERSPATVVRELYQQVVERRPLGIPKGADKDAIWPFLSKELIRNLDAAQACEEDYFRNHSGEVGKPGFAWLEVGLFSGANEQAIPAAAVVERTEQQMDGSFRVYVRLNYKESFETYGKPPNPANAFDWLVAAVVISEAKKFVVDDVLLFKDNSMKLDSRLRDSFPGCEGRRWVLHPPENSFSRGATNVEGLDQLIAPDGITRVALSNALRRGENHLVLTFDAAGRKVPYEVGRGIGAELLWSPDSKALAVTTSDASPNGVFNLLVFHIEGGNVRKINGSQAIRRAFGKPEVCAYPEPPNVAAITWIASSARLLVVAQIVNHSVCDSFGTFKLYELDIPSLTIGRGFDQLEAKRLFGSKLGVFLQHARDFCITDPKQCEVPANHQAKSKVKASK